MRVFCVLLALLLAACAPAVPEERPADFSIEYRSSPPIHPESFYTIVSIGPDGNGRIYVEMMIPHLAETRLEWAGTFQLDERAHDALYDVLREDLFGVRYPSDAVTYIDGGSSFTLTATAAGTTAAVPAYASESRRRKPRRLEDAVRDAVPDALWDELRAAQLRIPQD